MFLSTTILVITEDKICCETIDLFMHVDNTKFSRKFKWFLKLRLAQFSHLTFEKCHSELCGVFGIPRNGIFFHLINFLFITLTKREAAILKICPPAIITSAEVIIAKYDAILGQ